VGAPGVQLFTVIFTPPGKGGLIQEEEGSRDGRQTVGKGGVYSVEERYSHDGGVKGENQNHEEQTATSIE